MKALSKTQLKMVIGGGPLTNGGRITPTVTVNDFHSP